MTRPLGQRVQDGFRIGLWIAVYYSVIATAVFVITGGAVAQKFDMPFPAILGMYFVCVPLVGVLAGALSPLTRWWPGRILVCTLCVVPFALFAFPWMLPRDEILPVTLVTAAIAGPAAAVIWWRPWRSQGPDDDRE